MGEKLEETVKEIGDIREDLGEKVDALAGKLKEGAGEAKRKGLTAAGIIAAAILGILTLKRFRKK